MSLKEWRLSIMLSSTIPVPLRVDDNPAVIVLAIDYVNDTSVTRTKPKVTAMNSDIEVDITGQICSYSIDTYHYSGVVVKWIL